MLVSKSDNSFHSGERGGGKRNKKHRQNQLICLGKPGSKGGGPGGERRTQPDCTRLAIKTGIANHRCSAELKEEMLPRKPNPPATGTGHGGFTRGWCTHLSLPRAPPPPPRCLITALPAPQSTAHRDTAQPATGGCKPPWEGGQRLLGPPGACPSPEPSPSHPSQCHTAPGHGEGRNRGGSTRSVPFPGSTTGMCQRVGTPTSGRASLAFQRGGLAEKRPKQPPLRACLLPSIRARL